MFDVIIGFAQFLVGLVAFAIVAEVIRLAYTPMADPHEVQAREIQEEGDLLEALVLEADRLEALSLEEAGFLTEELLSEWVLRGLVWEEAPEGDFSSVGRVTARLEKGRKSRSARKAAERDRKVARVFGQEAVKASKQEKRKLLRSL